MNRHLLKSSMRTLAACAGMAVLCVVAALAQGAGASAAQTQAQPVAQQGQRSDGAIEMDVVHALDAAATLKNDLITAATIQSEVTLSGTVSTQASKQLAESIAAHVNGVTKVHNNLQVGNPGSDAADMQPAPDTGAMPDADQSQAQQGMAGLPPPGAAPNQGDYPYPNQPQNQSQAPATPPSYPQQGGYSGYPQQQGGYPSYPQQRPEYQRPQYAQSPQPYGQPYASTPPESQYIPATGPVTLPAGTLLQLRTSEPVDSKRAIDGQPVQFVVIQDVAMGGVLAIPRGAVVLGVVTESKNAGSGKIKGSSILALAPTSLDLGGRNYPLQTGAFRVKAPNKAGQTVGSALTGGLLGTVIGCMVGRGAGCIIGAGAGATAGLAAGAIAPGPRAWIPAEALVTFHLAAPLTVQPVSPQEAARLEQGLYRGGPHLYRRYAYGSPYSGYAPAYYAYPAPYYVPYFMVGGVYSWR